ncbi:MAG: exopolysaccharide Pel transporter PelG [Streptococcus salivarius]
MLNVMSNELKYVFWKQLLATIFIMFFGSVVLTYLPIGFNNQMHGYFLTLCLAYGLYAVGNVNILLLMYFADYKGAKTCQTLCHSDSSFEFCSQFLTQLPRLCLPDFFFSSFIESGQEIDKYTSNLQYHFLGSQTMVSKKDVGYFENGLSV